MRRIAIVGASLAGVHAAAELRDQGFAGELTLITDESHLPYDRPPLSKAVLQGRTAPDDLLLHPRSWYLEHEIDLLLGVEVLRLDCSEHLLELDGSRELSYDGLVIATGSHVRRHLPDDGHIRYLRTLDDAESLAKDLRSVKKIVVIGGGFLGLEIAATARSMDVEVSVVEIGPQPLNRVLGDDLGGWMSSYHARHGTQVLCSRQVVGLHDQAVELDDGTRLAADLVVAAVGAEPNVEWLTGSGIDVGDGVRCDSTLATNIPGVVAAGDVARWYNVWFDEEMRIEQWTNAVEQSHHAARTLLGDSRPYAPIPYLWTSQYGARMVFVGRANATDDARIEYADDNTLVAALGRGGIHVGALCINAPRAMIELRAAIAERRPFTHPA